MFSSLLLFIVTLQQIFDAKVPFWTSLKVSIWCCSVIHKLKRFHGGLSHSTSSHFPMGSSQKKDRLFVDDTGTYLPPEAMKSLALQSLPSIWLLLCFRHGKIEAPGGKRGDVDMGREQGMEKKRWAKRVGKRRWVGESKWGGRSLNCCMLLLTYSNKQYTTVYIIV